MGPRKSASNRAPHLLTPSLVAETVKLDPGCSWQGHSRRVGAGVGDESTESRGVVQPLLMPSVIRPERRTSVVVVSVELMSCCAAGANGCVALRRRALPLGGQVSAEWSRCPGAMARRARGSVVPL